MERTVPERKCSGLTTGGEWMPPGCKRFRATRECAGLTRCPRPLWFATGHRETTRRGESSWSRWENLRSGVVPVTSFSCSESMIQRVNYSDSGQTEFRGGFSAGCASEEIGKTVRWSFFREGEDGVCRQTSRAERHDVEILRRRDASSSIRLANLERPMISR